MSNINQAKLDYYREHPSDVVRKYGVCYEQALAELERDPTVYWKLKIDIVKSDSQHNYMLLRTIVSIDPGYIIHAVMPKSIPHDLLLQGLHSAHTWDSLFLGSWPAYKNPAFMKKYPEVIEFIELHKSLECSSQDCADNYSNWVAARMKKTNVPDTLEMPVF